MHTQGCVSSGTDPFWILVSISSNGSFVPSTTLHCFLLPSFSTLYTVYRHANSYSCPDHSIIRSTVFLVTLVYNMQTHPQQLNFYQSSYTSAHGLQGTTLHVSSKTSSRFSEAVMCSSDIIYCEPVRYENLQLQHFRHCQECLILNSKNHSMALENTYPFG